jgi:F-type H+-transporting ATPase subunit alpha
MPVEQQVVVVWAGTEGLLDDVPVEDVRRFEAEFLDHLRRNRAGILDTIRETGEMSDDTVTALKEAVADFRRGFETRGGGTLSATDEHAEPAEEEDIDQESVARRRPPAQTDNK